MLVDFALEGRLDVWVPVRMLERHQLEGDYFAASHGEATYANYRRYETGGDSFSNSEDGMRNPEFSPWVA